MESRTDSAGTWEYRVDRGELLRPRRRPNGTLLVDGIAAREGILEYRRADGSIRRELVTSKMLERANRTLGRSPLTLHHPDPQRYPQGVTTKNADELVVGDVDGTILMDGGFVRVQLAVRHQDAIDAIDAGTHELSPGYAVELGPGGEHPVYGRYDAEQLDRTYNHLALVDRARGGAEVRIRADAAVATTTIRFDGSPSPDRNPNTTTGGPTVKPLIAQLVAALGLAARFDTDDSALDACLAEVRSRRDAAGAAEATHRTALDAMTAQRDAEKARADAAEAKVRGLEQAEAARLDAAERADLEQLAAGLGVDPKLHADSKALRRAIAGKHLGSEVKADASDDYVRALVDLARAGASRDDGRTEGRAAWSPLPTPAPIPGGGGSPRQPAAPPPARADSRPSGRKSLFDVARQRSDSARASGGEA